MADRITAVVFAALSGFWLSLAFGLQGKYIIFAMVAPISLLAAINRLHASWRR